MGDFEKDLRDAFEGVEFTPSEQVWAGVEKGLRPKKKGIFYMWQTYGVAATLVLVLSLGYLFRDELFSGSSEGPATRELTEKSNAGEAENATDKSQTTEAKETTDEPASDSQTNDGLVNDATPGIKDLQANAPQTSQSENSQAAGTENAQNPGFLAADVNSNGIIEKEDVSLLNASATDQAVAATENTDAGEELLINPAFMGPLSLSELKESIAALKLRWDLKNLVGPMNIESHEGDLPEPATEARRTSLNGAFGNGTFNPNGALGSTDLAASEALTLDDPNLASC